MYVVEVGQVFCAAKEKHQTQGVHEISKKKKLPPGGGGG
jgi:hypothetical protein